MINQPKDSSNSRSVEGKLDHGSYKRDRYLLKKKPQKTTEAQKALMKVIMFFMILASALVLILVWAATDGKSPIAEKVRKVVGLKAIQQAPARTVEISESAPEPEPELQGAEVALETETIAPPPPDPLPIKEITYPEISRSKQLWPKTLELKMTKRVPIRYQDQEYGYMEFKEGLTVEVVALKAPDEIYCSVNGNFLSLSIEETNFFEWFRQGHGDRYKLKPFMRKPEKTNPGGVDLNTDKGEAYYLTQMRIWLHQNYDSISIEARPDTLVFKWLPNESVPIDFGMEAREIARKYLLLRSELGGRENYAACEIRHPITDELLGASSIYVPRIE